MAQYRSVDIIIPIYNAYEDLVLCLESIYKWTNLNVNRLVLINDNSPDERIKSYLDRQVRENVIVIHNEINKGFSNNINIGMNQSDKNDVILLNSDTVVTNGWVEKLFECAYSDRSIGTVTPTSNNATLCSVPIFCNENTLPEGMSIDQAGEIVERCSLKKYPRITVAHGFCMYVKREVINCIGNFDAKTFERGYGEENDFCNRAEQAGYYHAMCDNTFIYHSGTKSFISKEKEEYIKAHDQILRDRYPVQMRNNDIHCRDNPNFFVGDNVGLYFALANRKKSILYLVQSDFRKDADDHIGGTQLHVHDLTFGLKDKYNIFVAARDGDFLNLTIYFGSEERRLKFYIGKRGSFYEFRNKVFENLWKNILSAFHIDLIHVHHVITTSFDIFYVAKEYHIPLIFTAHDFYFICPSIKMLTDEDKICIGIDCEENCKNCLNNILGITDKINYIKIWREHCKDVLNICKQVIVPDQSALDIFLMYFPDIEGRIKVVCHGYNKVAATDYELNCSNQVHCNYEKVIAEGFTYRVEGWAYLNSEIDCTDTVYLQVKNKSERIGLIPTAKLRRPDVLTENENNDVGFACVIPEVYIDGAELELTVVIKHDDKYYYAIDKYVTPSLPKRKEEGLNIAFIGGLSKAKGGDLITDIISDIGNQVNWHIFGGIGVKSLEKLKRKNLIKTGYYAPEDLPVLLKEHHIDLIGILSIWPETYSYTLTEAILNGIPVIVADIGALGRRTKELQCGWTVPADNIRKNCVGIIKCILNDSKDYDKFKQNINKLRLPDIKEMTTCYEEIYNESWEKDVRYGLADYRFIYDGYRFEHVGKGNLTGGSQIYKQQLTNLRKELDEIQSSLTFKIVRKLWVMKIPGRSLIKKMVLALHGSL